MPILRALDGRSQPASAAQVSRTTALGTPAGVRRALERISHHGLCAREELGGRTLYSLNHHHVLFPAVRAALDANDVLLKRLRETLAFWDPTPVSSLLFGSAARLDGDAESDIDILLVRPTMTSGVRRRCWVPQALELRTQVRGWTGNHLHVLDWSVQSLRRYAASKEDLISEIENDGIMLYGAPVADLFEASA